MINIREATLDDAVTMAYIMRSLSHFYLDEGVNELPQWLLDSSSVSEFEYRLASDDFKSFVYIMPGQELVTGDVAGFITIKLLPKRIHLQSLFVTESNQKRGVARALWQFILHHYPARQYTVRSSLYAVPVYRQFGFVDDGIVAVDEGLRYQTLVLQS